MNAVDLFLIDFKECRRRFLLVAAAFPDELFTWKPDKDALSVGETIRHVLLHDLYWLKIFKENRLPYDEELGDLLDNPYTNFKDELDRSVLFYDHY